VIFVVTFRPGSISIAHMKALLFAIAVLTFAGCKKKEEAAPPPPAKTTDTTPAPAPATAPAASGLTDPQIAAIVVSANQVDIDAGQLAIKKTKNAEVKKFAELMVKDHTAVNQAAVELVTKLKVTPEESDTSKSLTIGGADTRAKLEKLEGAAFDKAYVDNEVAYHEAVINVLKSQLIPSSSNAELKAALSGAQPAFEAHLAHAKQVQEALAKGGSADHAAHGK
jgi:putative membrane protein